MQKIYGYKEKDVLGLIKYIKQNKAKSKTKVFEDYAQISKKSKGTVRNLYYAIAKHSELDAEFCKKYLGGEPIRVNESIGFNQKDEENLVTEVIRLKAEGNSVRRSIQILSKGDQSLALRYQNKFRNLMKKQTTAVISAVEKLKKSGEVDLSILEKAKKPQGQIDFSRIKRAVEETLLNREKDLKTENGKLKDRVNFLERENAKLINLLFGDKKENIALNDRISSEEIVN